MQTLRSLSQTAASLRGGSCNREGTGAELRAWLRDNGYKQSDFAERLGWNVGTLSHMLSGNRCPTDAQLEALQKATGGAIRTWERPKLLPSSQPGPVSAAREIGSHEEELKLSLANLTDALKDAETPTHVAALEGKRLSVLKELQRFEAARGIHEHPDFAGLVEDLATAVVEELGPNAPDGLEERIAARLEALQAARAEGATVRRKKPAVPVAQEAA